MHKDCIYSKICQKCENWIEYASNLFSSNHVLIYVCKLKGNRPYEFWIISKILNRIQDYLKFSNCTYDFIAPFSNSKEITNLSCHFDMTFRYFIIVCMMINTMILFCIRCVLSNLTCYIVQVLRYFLSLPMMLFY